MQWTPRFTASFRRATSPRPPRPTNARSRGTATRADVQKAGPGVEARLDYMVKLHDDIMARFPVGRLPEAALVTQRFTQAEVDELLRGPLNGGKHLYTG